MKKVLIVFWSGTGNTETMASAVAGGVREAGSEAELLPVDKASASLVKEAEALAFGCPAMGSEILEEDSMEPFIASLGKAELEGKKLGLFGSYDWGDGQWMRDWAVRMKNAGAQVDGEGIIAQLVPSEEILKSCVELGKWLAAD
jgi:flavodoxin short chain